MKITLCVPTRHRHRRVKEFLHSVDTTIEQRKKVEIALYIDKDDDRTEEHKLVRRFPRLNILPFRHDRVDGSKRYNVLADETDGDILGYFADDILFLNKGWDTNVIDIFSKTPDQIILLSPTDPDSVKVESKKATHGFVSRKSVNILEYFFPPGFIEYWHDQWLTEVYKSIDRFVVGYNVNVKHNSYRINKDLYDKIYARMNHIMSNGQTVIKSMRDRYYSKEQKKLRQGSIKKLRRYIVDFDKNK